MKKVTPLLFLLLFLAGCYGQPLVNVGTFGQRYTVHDLKGNEQGTLVIKPTRESFEGDLIFRRYAKEAEKYLIQKGFRVVTDESKADYVGYINYGFVTPNYEKQKVRQTVNGKSVYFETENYMTANPTPYQKTKSYYGVVTGRKFERAMVFKLYDLKSDGSKAKLILDANVKSIGSCNVINQLTVDLNTMMFKKWPPKQGSERIAIPALYINKC